MLSFKINGNDLSGEDMNLLICRDCITDKTELKMYCDHEEIQLDSDSAEIDVMVNIKSNGLTESLDRNRDIASSLDRLERVALAIRKEIANIRNVR